MLLPVIKFPRNSPDGSKPCNFKEGGCTNLSDQFCPPSRLQCTILNGDDDILFQGPVPKARRIDVMGLLIFEMKGLKFKITTLAPFEVIMIEEEGDTVRTTYNSYSEATAFALRPNMLGVRVVLSMMD